MKFVDELPKRTTNNRRNWADAADELRLNPGKWGALVEKPNISSASSMALAINRGTYAAFRPVGSYEAVVRGTVVYVRYIVGGS